MVLEVNSPYPKISHTYKTYLGVGGYRFVVHIAKNVCVGFVILYDRELAYMGQDLVVLPSNTFKTDEMSSVFSTGFRIYKVVNIGN